MKSTAAIFLFVLGTSWLHGQDVPNPDQGWHFSNRLQMGWEQDSNVLEDLDDPRQCRSMRLLFDARGSRKWNRRALHFAYRGGLQLYDRLPREHKLIQEVETTALLTAKPTLQVSAQMWGRLKLFLNQETDYAYGKGQLSLLKVLPAGFNAKGAVHVEMLDYAQSSFYNFIGPGGYGHVQYRFNRNLLATVFANVQWLTFNRPAYSDGPSYQVFQEPASHQKDHLQGYGLRIEAVLPGFIAQAAYRFENNASNSFAYDYSRHVAELLVGKTFAGFYLRGLLTLQKKYYPDDLVPFWPLQLDTEREENNYLVVDLSRALTPALDVMVRAAWYRNESIWANLYYQKTLLTISGEYHF